ncbi:MAG: methyltransferase domain-containing protein [Gemmatimonadaceae bacterium]
MDPKWYENFFQGIALETWRKAVSPEQTRPEVDFLQRVLRLERGSRVLDVPCGLGRHSLELASLGFRMTGVDQSRQMIEEGQALAAQAGLAIEWRNSDMRDLAWESEFDAGFCFGNSFGYLDAEGTRQFLQAVSRALKPGARFALDYGMAAECILPRFREREWAQVEDILFLEENRYELAESCIETTYTFVRDGKSQVQTGLHWVYTLREIRQLLEEAGLETEEVLRSLDGVPFEIGSPMLFLVAQKA